MRTNARLLLSAAVAAVAVQVSADTYTYSPASLAVSTNAWNAPATWGSTTFPNQAGDIADLTTRNITAGHTLNLNEAITVGQLNIGDSDGGSAYFLAPNGSGSLTLKGASAGSMVYINMPSAGTSTNTFSAPLTLGAAGYAAPAAFSIGTQSLATSATVTTNGNNILLTGGRNQNPAWSVNGDLAGNGTITVSSIGGLVVTGTKAFTGRFVLNSGVGGNSNSLSLTATSGSVKDSSEIVINGYVEQGFGLRAVGGGYHQGATIATATNPGQRTTSNTMTLNGGVVNMNSVNATVGAVNDWQKGLEYLSDTTATVNFSKGYALLATGAGTNNKGTRWNIGTVNHAQGATAYLRSGTLGGTARVIAGNGASLGIGGGGSAGTKTMNVVPWLLANNGNAFGQNGGMATYDTALSGDHVVGFRALDTSAEMSNTFTGALSTTNMNISDFAGMGAGVTTINALRHSGGSVSSIVAGKTLAIASGAVLFANGGGGLGAPGVGTVDFGAAEGVIWSLASGTSTATPNTNYIGSTITGTGGLTKAGTGILILRGPNIYSGQTTVAAGTLQVGDGTNASLLGDGDVEVAAGATLKLMNGNAIDDSATVTLDQYGIATSLGRLDIAAGIVEDISSLVLGDVTLPGGYYGSSAAATAYSGTYTVTANDTYFAGTGIVHVVPEPASLGLASLLTAGMLLSRRRSH